MKLKEVFYGLGLRPRRAREYPFALTAFTLEREGRVEFAQWQHPGALRWRTTVTQAMVDGARQFLAPGDVAVDIGAHAGDSTLPIALAVGAAGAVVALEPNPYAFKVLLANVALNKRKTNIHPLMVAAMPRDGDYEFEYSDAGFCNGGGHEGISTWRHAHFFKLPVRGVHLPSLLAREFPDEAARLKYVKIDTEGADRSVVASMAELLRRTRPYIRSEVFKHTAPEARVGYYRDLRELGYRVHLFAGEETYQGAELSEQGMLASPHFDIFCVPDERR